MNQEVTDLVSDRDPPSDNTDSVWKMDPWVFGIEEKGSGVATLAAQYRTETRLL